LQGIAEVLKSHPSVFILSDEIYEHIRFGAAHHSIAEFDYLKDRVIVVNGVSKGYAMTGWRIGYIAAPLEIAKACDKMQGQFTSAACSIAQKAALEAVSSDYNEYQFMRDSFLARRNLVLNMMKEIPGLKYNIPEGAFYVFPDVTYYFGKKYNEQVINTATDLCLFLLKEAKVSAVTGEAFGDNKCIRISYATSEEKLTEAFNRIKQALSLLK
jgi:aspartate aminotransferase